MSSTSSSIAHDYWSNAVQPRLALLDGVLEHQRALRSVSDDTWDAVNIELAALNTAASHVRFRRNSLLPICRVPPEILTAIFQVYISDCRFQDEEILSQGSRSPTPPLPGCDIVWIFSITHVCRHWRHVALECPGLWRVVNFNHGQSLWKEMANRAQGTPLVLDTWEPVRSGLDWTLHPLDRECLLTQISESEIIPSHIHHTETLVLSGCPTGMSELVPSITNPAPILETLSIAAVGGHSAPNDTRDMFPEDFLASKAPKLCKVVLMGCRWLWNSPLLKTLTHLEMCPNRHDPFAHTGSLMDLLDALNNTPELETLKLSNCLPFDNGVVSGQLTTILPALTSINLSGTAESCIALLTHIEMPVCAYFDVNLSSNDTTEAQFTSFLPFISASISRTLKAGKPIRSLEIEHDLDLLGSNLHVASWEHVGTHVDPVCKVTFGLRKSTYTQWPIDVFEDICRRFPLHLLTNLSLSSDTWRKEQWIEIFSHAVNVSSVSAADRAGESLISVLDAQPAHIPLSASAQNVSGPDGAGSGELFPRLTSLRVQNVHLKRLIPRDGSAGQEELGRVLSRRLTERIDTLQKLIL
ncbi:hypothetical protein OF83DRAFT_1129646, partial [Amylostereum chailletii]